MLAWSTKEVNILADVRNQLNLRMYSYVYGEGRCQQGKNKKPFAIIRNHGFELTKQILTTQPLMGAINKQDCRCILCDQWIKQGEFKTTFAHVNCHYPKRNTKEDKSYEGCCTHSYHLECMAHYLTTVRPNCRAYCFGRSIVGRGHCTAPLSITKHLQVKCLPTENPFNVAYMELVVRELALAQQQGRLSVLPTDLITYILEFIDGKRRQSL